MLLKCWTHFYCHSECDLPDVSACGSNEWLCVLDLRNISTDGLLGVVASLLLIMVLDVGSYRSPWASAYPLGLGYVFALGLEQGYTFAVETIAPLLMHKLVCILILLFVVVAHIDAQKDDYHTVLLD